MIRKMEEKAKVNVRGSMAAMAVGDTQELDRDSYNPRTVRNTATDLAAAVRKRYTVSVSDDAITVRRVA